MSDEGPVVGTAIGVVQGLIKWALLLVWAPLILLGFLVSVLGFILGFFWRRLSYGFETGTEAADNLVAEETEGDDESDS